ncbi:MAG TPA: hypothetical protein VME17_05665 [Bryobacteraceae bacterium]|nr:hypothetical protein [Bryobacteraceae bacterium]
MNRRFTLLALSVTLGFGMLRAQGQQAGGETPGTQPSPTADPYADNAAAGTLKFPLAPPPARIPAQSQPRFLTQSIKALLFEKSWKYGHAFDAPPTARSGFR